MIVDLCLCMYLAVLMYYWFYDLFWMFWLVKVGIAELFHSDCHILLEPVECLVLTLLFDLSIVFCLPLINTVSSEIFRVST